MSDKKLKPRGLGRGLSALMGDISGPEPTAATAAAPRPDRTVPIERLVANPDQPRRDFSPEALDDLAAEQVSTRHQQPYSVAWALLHALDHGALHLGHIEITRQLWLQRNAATD